MLATLLTMLTTIAACLLAKWVLVGKYEAGEHPMYSHFMWRLEWVFEFEQVSHAPTVHHVT